MPRICSPFCSLFGSQRQSHRSTAPSIQSGASYVYFQNRSLLALDYKRMCTTGSAVIILRRALSPGASLPVCVRDELPDVPNVALTCIYTLLVITRVIITRIITRVTTVLVPVRQGQARLCMF